MHKAAELRRWDLIAKIGFSSRLFWPQLRHLGIDGGVGRYLVEILLVPTHKRFRWAHYSRSAVRSRMLVARLGPT